MEDMCVATKEGMEDICVATKEGMEDICVATNEGVGPVLICHVWPQHYHCLISESINRVRNVPRLHEAQLVASYLYLT